MPESVLDAIDRLRTGRRRPPPVIPPRRVPRLRSRAPFAVWVAAAFAIVGLMLVGHGAAGLAARHQLTHEDVTVITATTVTESLDAPSESPVDAACDGYDAPDDAPLRVSVGGVEGCVQQVGVDQHGAVAVPTNINLAGWFVDSAAPGERGLSVIDGHVSGRYEDGLFKDLDQLEVGDDVEITRGDGSVLSYQVVRNRSVALDDAVAALFERDRSIRSQLNMITCGGSWSVTEGTYDERVVVTLELVGDSRDDVGEV